MTITIPEAETKLLDHRSNGKGKIFSVIFVKRTTGELRIMNARFGVRKGIKGVGLSFDAKVHGLIGVFDMIKNEYRFINVSGLKKIRIGGEEYEVKE